MIGKDILCHHMVLTVIYMSSYYSTHTCMCMYTHIDTQNTHHKYTHTLNCIHLGSDISSFPFSAMLTSDFFLNISCLYTFITLLFTM